ncbi:hypothetical protein AX16_000040 [Volvariella volvacea WC 439]|nr:hypothetical protein AX16_000040 [Volvariella volvacea WC 439]
MSVQTLPVELLNSVYDFLPQRDLLALSTTNYTLSWTARRRIYEHIDVSALEDKFHVLETLAFSEYHAHFVKSFRVRVYRNAITNSTKPPILDAFYRLLATALTKMTNLLSLSVHLDHDASWVLPHRGSVAFPYLEQFDTSFGLNDHVVKFLESAESIWTLTLGSSPYLPTTTLAPQLLPKLNMFQGSALAAQTLVPGRPLTTLHLTSGDLTESVVDSLARSADHVVELSATTSVAPIPLIASLAKNMGRLSKLLLMTTYTYTAPPDEELIQEIDGGLQELPLLEEFHFSGIRWQVVLSNSRKTWHPPVFGKVLPLEDDDMGYLA